MTGEDKEPRERRKLSRYEGIEEDILASRESDTP
jgi:hypothetical protein